MTTVTIKKLERLRLYGTHYELAMIRGDEQILIAYASNKSRSALWRAASDPARAELIAARAGTAEILFGKRVSDGAMVGEWAIRFTGRTQREAVIEGELKYIGDAV